MYVVNNLEKNIFFFKIPVVPLRDGVVNNDNFFDNSTISWRILLIVELDWDIDEAELCRKFHHDLTLLSKVIVLTDGRPDGHTDRFYSVLTFWVHKKRLFTQIIELFESNTY